jgi:predicted outer membrane repeat protein
MDRTADSAEVLAQKIDELNGYTGPHTISLEGPDVFLVEGFADEMFGLLAFPKVIQDITIEGNGRTLVRAIGAEKFRFFGVDSKSPSTYGKLTLTSLKLFNGDSDDAGGGAIVNDGQLFIYACHFSGNVSDTYGGAIYLGDSRGLVIEDSTFSNNTAIGSGAKGGAIFASTDSALSITNCSFFRNRVDGTSSSGGAIYATNGVSAQIHDSNVVCNTTLNSANFYAIFNASGTEFNIEYNWWGSESGPDGAGMSGSGDVVGGNVSVLSSTTINDTPGSQEAVIWYNRIAVRNEAIRIATKNFKAYVSGVEGFPQDYADVGDVVGKIEVGGVRDYSAVLTHVSGLTGSAIFASEGIYAGGSGMPMTFRLGADINDLECDSTDDIGSSTGGYDLRGWRYCPGELAATLTWKSHPGIMDYFTSVYGIGGIYLNGLDFDIATLADLIDTWTASDGSLKIGQPGYDDALTALIDTFANSDLNTLKSGDYMYLPSDPSEEPEPPDNHGCLIVGWGPVLDVQTGIQYALDNPLTVSRDAGPGHLIPYIVDFCFGSNGTDDGTGWLQDPRPRPFYSAAVLISNANLRSDQLDLLRVPDGFLTEVFDYFTSSTWQFHKLPDAVSIPLNRMRCL